MTVSIGMSFRVLSLLFGMFMLIMCDQITNGILLIWKTSHNCAVSHVMPSNERIAEVGAFLFESFLLLVLMSVQIIVHKLLDQVDQEESNHHQKFT